MTDVRSEPTARTSDQAAPALSGVRAGAFGLYRVLIVVFLVGLLVQVFLAGLGVFGAEVAVTEEAATEMDPHRALGHILSQPVALVLLIAAAIARPGRRIVQLTIAMVVVGVVQVVLGIAGGDAPFLGGLHVLNALIYLAVTAQLVRLANPGLGRRG